MAQKINGGATKDAYAQQTSRLHSLPPDVHTQILTASYWRGLMIIAFLLGIAWINLSRLPLNEANAGQATEAPMVGFLAPDFTLTNLDGGELHLAALRGKPVVLNFWATWCPPCRAEMPALEELWQRYERGDVVVIGVDQGERARVVEQFARDSVETTFPVALDQRRTVGTAYDVYALPTTFFIDAEGRIQEVKVGGPLNIATLLGSADKIAQK